jgi:hypothetical protein
MRHALTAQVGLQGRGGSAPRERELDLRSDQRAHRRRRCRPGRRPRPRAGGARGVRLERRRWERPLFGLSTETPEPGDLVGTTSGDCDTERRLLMPPAPVVTALALLCALLCALVFSCAPLEPPPTSPLSAVSTPPPAMAPSRIEPCGRVLARASSPDRLPLRWPSRGQASVHRRARSPVLLEAAWRRGGMRRACRRPSPARSRLRLRAHLPLQGPRLRALPSESVDEAHAHVR